ncbi:MAG: RnfABCDGE type electron transport complex subunit G [Lachnospiraceae bacterium]|nr:RnfABCDGE type electron transport complex subunit G [Lachnospiraceae bacterium]
MKKNSDVKIMLKEAGILFAITLIAGLVLGFVYELTKEPIRIQQEKAIQEACAAVFEDAAGFDKIEYAVPEGEASMAESLAEKGVEIGTIYAAADAGGSCLGYVIETVTHEGYGGDIILYMGVRMDGTLNGISLLEISETPGLGLQAEDVLVPQFKDKNTEEFTYTKTGSKADNEIDAISGATVTTQAIVNAVNGGLEVAADLLKGGADNE